VICCRFKQDSCCKVARSLLFRLSVETPTSEVFVYDLLAVFEKQKTYIINAFGGPRFDIESLGGTKAEKNKWNFQYVS
jgi:hypothetical protein